MSFYVVHRSLDSSVEFSSAVHRTFTTVHDKRDESRVNNSPSVQRMITVHQDEMTGRNTMVRLLPVAEVHTAQCLVLPCSAVP